MSKRILVALSGGVDSSMSAMYLKDSGFLLQGVYFKVHNIEDKHKIALQNVEKVSKFLNIPYRVVDFRKIFKKRVFDRFIEDYKNGLTPNPCTICNKEIKFGALIELAGSLECDMVASGHYVRSDGEFIYKGVDYSKDQSYFLFNVKQEALKKVIFPLGERFKEEVKREASKYPVFKEILKNRESNEICFVNREYTEILREYVECDKEGVVRNLAGEEIGKHKGYMHYTIGKRRGFDVPLSHEKLYVKSIDAKQNEIVVGRREELYSRYLEAKELNIFTQKKEFDAQIKVRYNGEAVPSNVKIEEGVAKIYLKKEVFAIAKGQAAVFYENDKLLGGGFIV